VGFRWENKAPWPRAALHVSPPKTRQSLAQFAPNRCRDQPHKCPIMQSPGITLPFHREMADASRKLVGPSNLDQGSTWASPPCCRTADWCLFKTARNRGGSGNRQCDACVRRSPYREDSGRSRPFWPRARQRNCTSIYHHVLHGLRGKLSGAAVCNHGPRRLHVRPARSIFSNALNFRCSAYAALVRSCHRISSRRSPGWRLTSWEQHGCENSANARGLSVHPGD
jgi:hypothetical protein